MFSKQRGALALLALAFIAGGGVWSYHALALDPPGYCEGRERLFSDQQLAEIGVASQSRLDLGSSTSAAQFIAANPDCCKVQRRSAWSTRDKFFGPPAHMMQKDYLVEVIYSSRSVIMDLDGCGRVQSENSIHNG